MLFLTVFGLFGGGSPAPNRHQKTPCTPNESIPRAPHSSPCLKAASGDGLHSIRSKLRPTRCTHSRCLVARRKLDVSGFHAFRPPVPRSVLQFVYTSRRKPGARSPGGKKTSTCVLSLPSSPSSLGQETSPFDHPVSPLGGHHSPKAPAPENGGH